MDVIVVGAVHRLSLLPGSASRQAHSKQCGDAALFEFVSNAHGAVAERSRSGTPGQRRRIRTGVTHQTTRDALGLMDELCRKLPR